MGSENQTGPPLPPRDNLRVKEKGSLNELIASIKVTCELVAHMAQELKHQESEEGKDNEAMTQPTQTLDELYMETMKPLQFGKHLVLWKGYSSAGRALALQARGPGFNSQYLQFFLLFVP